MSGKRIFKDNKVEFAIGLVGLFLTGIFSNLDLELRQEEQRALAGQVLGALQARINEVFYRRFNLIASLEAFVNASAPLDRDNPVLEQEYRAAFERFANSLSEQSDGVLSLQLAPDAIVTYLSNPEQNAAAIGHDLLLDDTRRADVLRAISGKRTIVDGPTELLQGGNAIIARKAIFVPGWEFAPDADRLSAMQTIDNAMATSIPRNFWGLVTVLMDAGTLLDEMDLDRFTDFDIALRGRHGLGYDGELIYGDIGVFNQAIAEGQIVLPDGAWVLAVRPHENLYYAPWLGLIGILLTLLAMRTYTIYARSRLAEAESEAKSDFLAVISHEIRTPLNGIMGVASVLQQHNMPAEHRDLVGVISTSSQSLLSLVDDILDFSRIEAGEFKLEPVDFSLRKSLSWISSLIDGQLQEKDIAFNLIIDDSVPDCIHADQKRIHQILLNLLQNAVKFTERGHVTLNVSMEGESKDDGSLIFVIEDTGIGIERSALHIIFNAFSQASASINRKYGGSGLGLTIVRSLCQTMGGDVGVTSEPGKGSIFTARIKVGQAKDSKNCDGSSNINNHEVAVSPPKVNVLIVEDNPLNTRILALMLQRLNATVSFAENGEEAIQLCRQQPFDVIFMDSFMPVMDGTAATQVIRGMTKSTVSPWIISVSANVSDEHRLSCLKAGMNDVLGKPLTFEQVRDALSRRKVPN